MRKILTLAFLFIALAPLIAQTKLDTIVTQHTQQIQSLDKKTTGIQSNVDTIKKGLDLVKTFIVKSSKDAEPCTTCTLGFWEVVLVFSPVWVFGLALFAIRKKLKGFSLKDALTESDLPKKTIPNPEYTSEKLSALAEKTAISNVLTTLIPPTIEITATEEYPKSSSRYIALITSALTWIIALCLSCFFLYQYITTNKPPDLSGLSNVLLALGIGVVPYAFNKMSGAVK